MIENDIRAQAKNWHARLLRNLEFGGRTFEAETPTLKDIEYLKLIPEASDIYRFKLFDKSGKVIWSTRASDMGTHNTKPYWTAVVAQGDVYYKTAVKPTSEIDNFHGVSTENQKHLIIEIYEPVLVDGAFTGAIEFYSDITQTHAIFLSRVRTVMIAAAVATGLLLVFIMAMALSAARSKANLDREQAEEERKQVEANQRNMENQLRLAREVQLLGELNEWLQSSSSLEELFGMVARYMEHLLPESLGSLYVYSNSRDVLDGSIAWNGGTVKDHIRPTDCWGLRRGRTYAFGESEVNFACEHTEPHDDTPYFCFPILAHGETVGLMHLKARQDADRKAFNASRKLAQMCAEQISLAIANVQMRDELQDQSSRDPLTGLFNRRFLTEALRKAANKAEDRGEPFALISIDVDHFKKFNDTYGHDAGDVVLRSVAKVLEKHVDGDEIACRMGGEEFMIMLPGALTPAAMIRAESVRKAIEAVTVRYGEKNLPHITISAGVAAAPDHGSRVQDLIKSADDALYEAKSNGRNCIVEAQHPDDGRTGTAFGQEAAE